jgi:hypothetical protein
MMTRVHLLLVGLAACGDNIHPGSEAPTAARVVTDITPNPVVAGATLTATCTVYDSDGNVMTGVAPTLFVTPGGPTVTVTDYTAVLTKVGTYAAQCGLPDLPGNIVPFDVLHALPATLMIDRSPSQQVYAIGAVITITHAVADKYGNAIPEATISTTSTPVVGTGPTLPIIPDAYSYGGEGKYHIDASVDGPTDGGLPVTAQTDIIINQTGPLIACGSPVDASMNNIAPGTPITFTGSATDINGTQSVTLNGTPVTVAIDGSFSTTITSRFGINFVDVVATDTYGVVTTKVCTFLAASQWATPGALYGDTVMLRLAQSAIDDGSRAGAINSLGDILSTVENSQGLKDTLNTALLAANPLKPNSCDQQVCVFGACVCVLSSQIDYISSSLPGPNTDTLTLVNGGIAAVVTIDNPVIRLRAHGSAAGIGYDTTGDVDIDYIQIALTFDISVDGSGRPNASIRPNSVSTSVGSISTNFSGIDGFIINLIVSLANGTVRNIVANTIRNYVTNNFNSVLDGIVSNLDISTLGATFDVPRLDGTGSVPLAFGVGLTSLDTTPSRMLFGIGTRLTAATGNMYPTLGIAVPNGTVAVDPSAAGQPVAASAHVAIINQALHALWKANFFAATIDGTALSAQAPPGLTIQITTRLPPVASFDASNNVALGIGAVDLALSAPSLPPNLSITLGARAHTAVSLVGNSLSFTGIVLDEVHLSSDTIDLTSMQQMQLESTLQALAQQLVDTSLNQSLPSLPIPSFTLPASLAQFGLPTGGQLGITTPSLAVIPPEFVLRGGFGIQ